MSSSQVRVIDPATPGPYLTTKEAAAYLSVSRQLLELMRSRGDGPRFCRVGRLVRYARADLDLFMAERQEGGAP